MCIFYYNIITFNIIILIGYSLFNVKVTIKSYNHRITMIEKSRKRPCSVSFDRVFTILIYENLRYL